MLVSVVSTVSVGCCCGSEMVAAVGVNDEPVHFQKCRIYRPYMLIGILL